MELNFVTFFFVMGVIFTCIIGLVFLIVTVNICATVFYTVKYRQLKKLESSKALDELVKSSLKGETRENIEKNNGKIETKINFPTGTELPGDDKKEKEEGDGKNSRVQRVRK